ncbi:MAG: hypothetical protein FJ215_03175 [Ignavibacteria bacterium]|nr:hypothetical protein [Ignavibacteria bacterium]
MTSRERMATAMRLGIPDRVPVMCQLSLGHYFLHAGLKPMDIWYTSEGFAEALVTLQKRYRFDGILVNLPGREPDYEDFIESIERGDRESIIRWKNGDYTLFPDDDNPHYFQSDGTRYFPAFGEIDPEQLYYVEPWDVADISYPHMWGLREEGRAFHDFFPSCHFDTIRKVREKAGESVSLHSEIYSPWSQFLELLNYEHALVAILDDPGKAKACLERLTEGAVDLATRQASCGVDAVLISSAFAGGGFLSPQHYEEFVLPYEKKVIEGIHAKHPMPVYTHTCGSIGDRLDLMVATGTNGIDTLDPPPLGTVDLAEAKKALAGRTFIKGNIDPVNTLLLGNSETVRNDVKRRLGIGMPGGGYILSSACSVSPHTPRENIETLALVAEEAGVY